MDNYQFEEFVEKPFVYKSEKEMKGLSLDHAMTCLLFVYFNSWNSQAVVNKITATGIWRGSVALSLVTYFFTLPTVILCLYLGKFLKHGALSLHNCNPLLCGVGVLAYILAFPLGAMMVYYPLSEDILMKFLTEFGASLPPCAVLKERFEISSAQPCVEEKSAYNCCTQHSVMSQSGDAINDTCVQPRFPFFLLNLGVGNICRDVNSLFRVECDYWLIFFCICLVVIMIDIKGIHKMLSFVEKFYEFNMCIINLLSLLHIEIVLTGFTYYYFLFDELEELTTTLYDLMVMEIDHVSMSIPFLLMIGRLIDDSVLIDKLTIKLATHKLVRLFWQANEYMAVISVVAAHYNVDYLCLHNARKATLLSMGIVPEFLTISKSRILKYPAMISYFASIFLKKVGSLILFGNLLAYHLYFWEERKANNEQEKPQIKKANIRGKFIHSIVKVIVYIILNICQRIFNLKYPMIPAMMIGATVILSLQLCLFSVFLLPIHFRAKLKSDIEATTRRRVWPEYLTHLKLQPLISSIFTLLRLIQYYVYQDVSIERISAVEAKNVTMRPYYMLYPVFYLIPVFLISLTYIIFNFVTRFKFRVISPSKDWGPVDKEKWKQITPFNPGRKLIFYDKFYFDDHPCFMDHKKIIQVSMDQIQNIQLFIMKWPIIFDTNKYKDHKEEIDNIVTEAYTWGILASFEKTK